LFGLKRKGKLPAAARPKLDRDERIVAWSSTVDDAATAVVVTTRGLFLPGRERLGWHEIHKATWSGSRLTVIPAVPLTPTEGHTDPADSTPVPADATPASADGTPVPADATPASADGTESPAVEAGDTRVSGDGGAHPGNDAPAPPQSHAGAATPVDGHTGLADVTPASADASETESHADLASGNAVSADDAPVVADGGAVVPVASDGAPVVAEGYTVMADGAPIVVALADPDDVPAEIRDRVTRSVAYTMHHPVPGGGVRVVGRRVSGRDGLTWNVRYDDGTDAHAPDVVAATNKLVADASAEDPTLR
jgi:hypothetical protein